MSIIDDIMKDSLKRKIPRFKAGDTVRVYLRIKEGEKERVQYYEGVVIGIHNNGISSTFKVRKESYGVGVERTFPLFSPLIQKIEVKRRGDVRRAKLYYLRKLSGKKAKVKEKKDWMLKKSEVEAREAEAAIEEETPVAPEAVVDTPDHVADTPPVEAEALEAEAEEAVEEAAVAEPAAPEPEEEGTEPEAAEAEAAEAEVAEAEVAEAEAVAPKEGEEQAEKGSSTEDEEKGKETGKKPRGKKS